MGPEAFNILYQFLVNFAFLLFAAMGLIVVLGMLNIINLAHGEFIMLGAYVATLSYHAGVPFALTIPIATITVGLLGIGLERTVIRRFYANKLNALVATFGISLILSQAPFWSLAPTSTPSPCRSAASFTAAIPIPPISSPWPAAPSPC